MRFNLHRNIILIFILISLSIKSQTNEVGLFLGGGLFHGDVGYNNAENAILDSKPVFGFEYKRNLNYHFGITLMIKKGELSANDKSSLNLFSIEQSLHFKSKITELGLITEFNFRPYLSRDNEHNITPFIFAGITKFFFSPQAKHPDGNWYNLRPLHTEGQMSDLYPDRPLYSLDGISIPFGLGYKFNVYDFLTLNLNMGWRITFTDYIDDVSTNYVDTSILSDLGSTLANPSDNEFKDGFQRGNSYNNDKYGFWGITILYSIKDPIKECDNIVY
tara:strand:- start:873 stop:1697 length:825 start_codon:yes stop_codon:yes gene_type:complete